MLRKSTRYRSSISAIERHSARAESSMEYADRFRAMYLAHCASCVTAGIAAPTPSEWANLIYEMIQADPATHQYLDSARGAAFRPTSWEP